MTTFSFWGGHYPDDAGNTTTGPAVAAQLALSTVVTTGLLDDAFIRARAAGTDGNSIQVRFTSTSLLLDSGRTVIVTEDLVARQVTVLFVHLRATVSQLAAALSVDSTLVDMVGSWNGNDILTDDDVFSFTNLSGGLDASGSDRVTYWGPHYPMIEETIPVIVPRPIPVPPPVATLGIQLESGLAVTLEWETAIFKSRDALEKRASALQDPRQTFVGVVFLVGDQGRDMRTLLAESATSGDPFSLALPYEELTIAGTATINSLAHTCEVPVFSTAKADWANPGQPVVIMTPSGVATDEMIIQEVTATSITVSPVPSLDLARYASRIMPTCPVFLDPAQGFARFPNPDDRVERWEIKARSAIFGFPKSAVPASLALSTVTTSGILDGVKLVAHAVGRDGNGVLVRFLDDGVGPDISYTDTPTELTIHYVPGVSTLGDLDATITGRSLYVGMFGTWDPADVMAAGTNAFIATPLTGGSDAGYADMGKGVAVTKYDGKLIWDRPIDIDNGGTADDSMQSMVEIIDLGGVVRSERNANRPDWGRSVALMRPLGDEWQWMQAFLYAVRGRWKSWWLPTWRPDLVAIGNPIPGSPAVRASLPLEEPVTFSGALAAITIRARAGGAAGNGIQFRMQVGTLSDTGDLNEDLTVSQVTVLWNDGDRVGDIIDLINARSALVTADVTGIGYNPDAALVDGEDDFDYLDLEHGVDAVPSTIVLDSTVGKFFTWYGLMARTMLRVEQESITTYMKITGATDNLDGTITIQAVPDADASSPAAEPVEKISWMELCRFESDRISVLITDANFKVGELARAVTR